MRNESLKVLQCRYSLVIFRFVMELL
ncbi:unnamed protein product [Callosobruchus maculatus]|uniref:Uncharacterized protein n=1 Tax=Callosobruchus maculatus TaxID=64391 RepID=A0A653DAB1_CALMS|nr:unnamed protein product [Callosobruchus maculatus]VEN50565.1 unnamed protein product [Callosobruchus maculatus]VEN52208.1 unnamed protein product [Callosobruchus maculatus]VEN55924.1 unnamed protein product [Callosobruchus maculatus]VEN57149.1 unnamed protein product [Callosobruchus maculatus]